jgi:hypothetical protein
MKIRSVKHRCLFLFGLLAALATAGAANAQTNHGGPVIVSAKVVFLFWGPTFSNAVSPDHTYATTLQAYRNQLGTTPVYGVLKECGVWPTNLGAGAPDWFDTSPPPTKVTDAVVRGEINKYLTTHTRDASTVYEVVLPSTSHSSNGTSTSCGGSSLAYCSYHSWIGSGSTATKYSIQPYPSCAGCKVSGWSDVQNQEHFVEHETANAVTDPVGNGCLDSSGNEIADKCSWSPSPFLVGAYGYQYLSGALGTCVNGQ